MKILMVDDNNFSLEVAKNALTEGKVKCETILCNSGRNALEILKLEPVDIILLDIIMPDITGIQLLKQIREIDDYKDIQILMLTSITDKISLKECFDSGANDFINKPLEPTEFVARVNAAIKLRRYHNELNKAFLKVMEQNRELSEVTERLKEAQLFLVQKEKMAAVGELAAGIAHEINNPIGFISSNFETLSRYIGNFKLLIERYRELLADIKPEKFDLLEFGNRIQELHGIEKSLHLDFMISDIEDLIKDSSDGISRVTKIILSLRRFARTGTEDELTYNEIDEIIEEALMITKNEIKYTADVELDLCEINPVYCNRGQIGQVIINIILNAVQAVKGQKRNDKGHIRICVYQENVFSVIKISDDGSGISEVNIGKIFDPFFTTKEIGKGTGLGLSICYDIIVNKHKGEIFATSRIGEGTDFYIKLPEK